MKKIILLILTVMLGVSVGLFAGCKSDSEEMKFIKDVPTEITCGSEIYFMEYINVDYKAEYELYASYTDNEKKQKIENKLLDSLMLKFDNVSNYDFKLTKVGANTLTFSIKSIPIMPELKEPNVYKVSKGSSEVLDDLIFWCGLELKNDDAKLDPAFRWEFSKVNIKSASVNDADREESLEGVTSYTFSSEAEYVFSVKAANSKGEQTAEIVVSTMNVENHSDEVSGYVFEDDKKVEFDVGTLKHFNLPDNGQIVKTRLNDDKYDAVYNAATQRFSISGFDKELSAGTNYRLYVTDGSNDCSVIIVVPDLIVNESNFKELETVTKGVIVLSQDVDMNNVSDYGAGRAGKNYNDYWFKGTFDGRGYTISNYKTYNMAFAGGLFWSADGAIFKNVIFKNAEVKSSNAVIAGRTRNYSAFKNIAIEASAMNMSQSGAISGPGEFGSTYENCILYVRKNSGADIVKSGFVNGLYCRSAEFNNAYLVSATKLPVASVGHGGIVPAISGEYQLLTAVEAKNMLNKSYNWGTKLLNDAAKAFFSGKVEEATEDEADKVVHLNKNNIEAELLMPVKGTYILDEDIDMSGFKSWGSGRNAGDYKDYYFQGTLDGNGHTISNFKVTQPSFKGGLLWSTNGSATIKNIVFKNAEITLSNAGLIAGRAYGNTVVENVFVEMSNITGTTNGLFAPMNGKVCTYKNVAIYVKNVSGDIVSSAAIAGFYAEGVRLSDFYFITDTELPLAPKHASITTELKNANGSADAVKGTDYYEYGTAEAKKIDKTTLKTELLRKSFAEIFGN